MKKLMLVALLAVAVAGCGDDKPEIPTFAGWIGGEVVGAPTFMLPGPVQALKSAQDQSAQSGKAWFFEKAQWKPKGWSLWVASNVYSDYKTPRNDLEYLRKGFARADAAHERAKQDSNFIGGISKWLKANNVNVELNFLGYDSIPGSLKPVNDAYKGYWLTYNNQPCERAFRLCVNNYFVSPAARLAGGTSLSFKEWISPYLVFGTDLKAAGQKDVIASQGGMSDERSPFFDYWPTMVFLVNPEGKVTRAWLPQKNDAASVQRVQGAIVADVGGEYRDLPIPEDAYSPGPSRYSYYGQYFIETGVQAVIETFQEIQNSK
ncbi:hypothetical protein [Pseudomonas violetae]|uniref:Lipoprotein n=1 Tax=Pseudomonas violetae TaxID=2915813 RepID=A0ABT0ET57_9PSED|nr:hypothetical protein [Pseudomonas violetae]MCK1788917.1 hypothetical protein [Pseudomonas violetae]